jgi:hypothetical protein
MVRPKLDLVSCLRCHLFAIDKESDWLERDHLTRDGSLHSINCDSLFGCVIAYAIELCFLTELVECCIVVPVCLDMCVVCSERQASVMN